MKAIEKIELEYKLKFFISKFLLKIYNIIEKIYFNDKVHPLFLTLRHIKTSFSKFMEDNLNKIKRNLSFVYNIVRRKAMVIMKPVLKILSKIFVIFKKKKDNLKLFHDIYTNLELGP